MRRIACLAVLGTLLAGCAWIAPGASPTSPEDGPQLELAEQIAWREELGLRADEAWVRRVMADPEAVFTDPGIQVTPAELAELEARMQRDDRAVQIAVAYGQEHAGEFAGVYIDRENGAQLVARFTANLERHQAELDRLTGAPGLVLVRRARFTEQELLDIQGAITDAQHELAAEGIELMGVGSGGIENAVTVSAKSNDPGAEQRLKAFGPPGSILVELFPLPGPWHQTPDGPGWRLVDVHRTSLAYTVGVARTADELAAELERHGIEGEPPEWDPTSEVMAFLSEGIGSSCPEVRIDGVVIDAERRLVFGEFSDPLAPRGCTADLAGGQTFVVALQRAALPDRFILRQFEENHACHPECGSGPSEIEVDLR
jgi:hypothetical protein